MNLNRVSNNLKFFRTNQSANNLNGKSLTANFERQSLGGINRGTVGIQLPAIQFPETSA